MSAYAALGDWYFRCPVAGLFDSGFRYGRLHMVIAYDLWVFPIVGATGVIERFDTNHCKCKYLDKSGDTSILLRNASPRFTNRPKAQKPKRRADLWADAMGRIKKGWMGGPFPRPNAGGLIDNPAMSVNRRFRFLAEQIDKVRDCGDFRLAIVNRSPIHLLRPYRVYGDIDSRGNGRMVVW